MSGAKDYLIRATIRQHHDSIKALFEELLSRYIDDPDKQIQAWTIRRYLQWLAGVDPDTKPPDEWLDELREWARRLDLTPDDEWPEELREDCAPRSLDS